MNTIQEATTDRPARVNMIMDSARAMTARLDEMEQLVNTLTGLATPQPGGIEAAQPPPPPVLGELLDMLPGELDTMNNRLNEALNTLRDRLT